MNKCSFLKKTVLFTLFIALTACERQGLAPVVELNWRAADRHARQHIVKRGDTLYAIAFRYDTDYRQLAIANGLRSPYSLQIGQVIRLQSNRLMPQVQSHYVSSNHKQAQPVYRQARTTRNSGHWVWPAFGRVVAQFVPQQGKKGIDIAGSQGGKVYAAANGLVAYAGSGLAGYGNLIIIRHNNQFLTAYGNNARNLVREGQAVKAGQIIANMGVVDRRFLGVHFEIRKAGQPVNPLNYLSASG